MLWLALHFPGLPPDALASIAAWACQFTPKVSLEPPRELLLEVQGSLRLHGGLEALHEQITAGLLALGFSANIAASATPRAALWLARGEGETLDKLPVEVTQLDVEFFRSIGVSTVGELLRLPRNGLAQRCGAQVAIDLDRALGVRPEPRAFFEPPPRFSAGLELHAEVSHAEALLFGAHRLLLQLEGLLRARQAGVRGFKLRLIHEDRSTIVEIGLASPARDAERLSQLLRERLASLALPRPVEALRLEAGDFVPLPGRSGGMFGDAAGEAEGWARLLERLRTRLGHDVVHGLTTHPDHRPEHAWRRVEPGEWDPHEFSVPGPRPSWLLTAPRKLVEGQFTPLTGPERIESGWWDGDDAKRDYFVARLPNASLAWVYRESGEWYLHGLFA
jgi:protein ImuB